MKRFLRIAYALALLAGAGVCAFFGKKGFETDVYALAESCRPAGDGRNRDQGRIAELARNLSTRVRVLCSNEAQAAACRAVFRFDDPVDPKALYDLVRTRGAGLLSEKDRDLLERGEAARIRRSAVRRDHSGVGLFPKDDDPDYFLHDFVMDLGKFMPKPLPEGQVLLEGDAADNPPEAIAGLVALAREDDGIALSGPAFHSHLATRASVREINLLSGISLVSVLALGFRLFRSVRFVLPTVLALGCGFLAGTAALFLLPGRPHMVTFVFGTSLIGLGVDYCYHGLAARKPDFVRNLSSALITTCLAFSPLLLSTVGVLNQMALFTITGLVAIYLCVVLFFRPVAEAGDLEPPGLVGGADGPTAAWLIAGTVGRAIPFPRGLLPLLRRSFQPLVLSAAFAGLCLVRFGNDPARFHAMDPLMARGEAAVAEATGSGTMKFKILGLDAWQKSNAALKETNGFAAKGGFLSAADLPRMMVLKPGEWDLVVLPSEASDAIDVKTWFVRFFDEIAAQAYRLLAASAAVLLLVMGLVFRRKAIAHLLPVAGAALATAGVLGWLGEPVNFFQTVSFFAVVGLGVDYVIFNRSEGADALQRKVVRYSFLTSLVGFGLLAFTSFPVTRGMGVTLAIGLGFAYALSRGGAGTDGTGGTSEHWGSQKEQAAGKWRILFMFWIYKTFGKTVAKLIAVFPVVAAYPFLPKKFGFRKTLNFAWSLLDKLDACSFRKNAPRMTLVGDAGWTKGGCFLLSTHVGCIEVLPALANESGIVVHAFQQMGHDAIYTSVFMKHLDASRFRLHAVEDIGVETAVEMQEAVGRGEIVLMAGDRPPAAARRPSKRSGSVKAPFLGREALFPRGAFRFAALMESPVYAIACVRTGWNAYEVRAKRLGADLLGDYTAFLEREVRSAPDQWFQFYDVFA